MEIRRRWCTSSGPTEPSQDCRGSGMSGLFQILRVAGSGAVARVLHARRVDAPEGVEVALKVLRPENIRDPALVRRFRDESRILRQIEHPNVVRGFGMLDYDGHLVMEMEWVDGCNLEEMIHATGPLPAAVAAGSVCACASALHAVWEMPGDHGNPLHILHRDLKPGNLAIGTEGQLKVMDFGYAKGDISGRAAQSIYDAWGTMGFDAPERRDGGHSQASDIYALGVSLFVFLTGSPLLLSTKKPKHDSGLTRALAEISDLDIASLIRDMLVFEPENRIAYPHLIERLTALFGVEEQRAALKAYAQGPVHHRVSSRNKLPPQKDFSWGEVEFLQQVHPTPEPGPLSREEASEKLARLMRLPDWHDRVGEIEPIMEAASSLDPEVFVKILRCHTVPWYSFGSSAAPADHLVAALMLLDRVAPTVALHWASELANHPAERVRDAVAHVLRAQ